MRVLHIYHDFWPTRGGIEDVLDDLTRAQAAHGDEPIVLCANDAPRTRDERRGGVRLIRAASFGRYYTPFCPSWPSWLRRLQPDAVHLHLPCPLGEWAVWLARPRRLAVSLHNDYVRPRFALRFHRPLHRTILKRAQAIMVAAPDYARTSPVLHDLQAQVRIVPYGIALADSRPFATPPTRSDAAQDFRRVGGLRQSCVAPLRGAARKARHTGQTGWQMVNSKWQTTKGNSLSAIRHQPDVLFAGRLCYYKGVEVLLAAAPKINAHLSIIGDGPWRARLQAQARQMQLDGSVCFRGAVDEQTMIAQMRASRVFVFPSTERSEAFGIAQLKAMACGLPVVSTNLPGVSWLNRHGETGLTVPVHDAVALASAVNQLLDDSPLRERLAAGARERAGEFTLDQMVREMQRVYASIA